MTKKNTPAPKKRITIIIPMIVNEACEIFSFSNCSFVRSAKYTRYEKAAVAIMKKIIIVTVKGILFLQIYLN